MSGIEISKKLVLINSASSAVALVVNLSVLVWLQQYLLKRISTEEYALIPLIMAVMAFTPLLTMVLTGGLGRFITVAYARGDNDEITRICSTMFPLLFGAGVAFWAIGWFGAWHIDKLLDIPAELVADARLMMALLVFSAGLRLPLAVFGSGFIVRQKLMLQDMIDVGCQVFRIGLLFSLLFGIGVSVLWVTVALVVSELANMVIATPISIRLVPAQRVRRDYLVWSKAKELTSYGGWGLLNQIGETLKQAMDPLILNRFASSVDVSVLYVAGIVPRQVRAMLMPITRPFIPVLAIAYANNDYRKLRNVYLRVARYHSWLLLCFSAPIVIFSDDFIRLYLGGLYSESGVVMVMLISTMVLSSYNALGPAVAGATGDVKGLSLRMILVQLFNVVLTVILVAYYDKGAYGAALSTLISTLFLEGSLVWAYCRDIIGITVKDWVREVLFVGFVPTISSIVFCMIVKLMVEIDGWLVLIGCSIVSWFIFVSMVIVFCLKIDDRSDIKRLSNYVPGRFGSLLKFIANMG